MLTDWSASAQTLAAAEDPLKGCETAQMLGSISLTSVRHAGLYSLGYGFAALVLAACVVLPVPPLGSQIGQEEIGALKPGASTREDVHTELGDPDNSVTERFEVFELSKETGYLTVITILPGIAGTMRAGGQDFRVVAEYAPDGVLENLRWEGRVEETESVRYLSYDRGKVTSGTAIPEPSVVWDDPSQVSFKYRAIAASPDGRTLAHTYRESGAQSAGILLRDGQTGLVLREIAGYPAGCPALGSADGPLATVFLSDSRHLASVAENAGLCVWLADAREQAESRVLFSLGDRSIDLTSARSAPILATVDDQGSVRVWDGLNGSQITSITPCPSDLSCPASPQVALSDDGGTVATLQNALGSFWALRRSVRSMLRLWDARTGAEIVSLDLPEWLLSAPAQNLAWSPDRRRLALNLGNHVQVWQTGDHGASDVSGESRHASPHDFELEMVLPLPPTWRWQDGKSYPRSFPSIAFSADGGRLAAGYASAVVWEVDTWRQLWRAASAGPPDLPDTTFWNGFAFSGDGGRIITTCCLWRLPEADEALAAPASVPPEEPRRSARRVTGPS